MARDDAHPESRPEARPLSPETVQLIEQVRAQLSKVTQHAEDLTRITEDLRREHER